VHIAIADKRLVVERRPAFRSSIEVHEPRVHRVVLDRIEQIGILIELPEKAVRSRKKGMRRNNQPRLAPSQCSDVVKRSHIFGASAEIDEQHVAAAN
jgi:hypothetical protein